MLKIKMVGLQKVLSQLSGSTQMDGVGASPAPNFTSVMLSRPDWAV